MIDDTRDAHASASSPETETIQRPVTFEAGDGFPLAGTVFEGPGDGPMVLISSATAVPQGLYAGFARHLVANGARAVLIYDYRGTAASPRPRHWRRRIDYKDWALQDFPAALRTLETITPSHEIVGLGQSHGGHAFCLSGTADRFSRYAMVATMSGYWDLLDDRKVWARMNLVGVPVSLLTPSLPRWLGIGEPIPSSCFRDWARWCRMKNYFFDDPNLPETARFAEVRTPILAIGLTDDPWATPRAVDHFLARHLNAPVEQRWISPQDAAGQRIGHLGFFRTRFAPTLWPPLAQWLLRGAPMSLGTARQAG